jgi:hypothetical protein
VLIGCVGDYAMESVILWYENNHYWSRIIFVVGEICGKFGWNNAFGEDFWKFDFWNLKKKIAKKMSKFKPNS